MLIPQFISRIFRRHASTIGDQRQRIDDLASQLAGANQRIDALNGALTELVNIFCASGMARADSATFGESHEKLLGLIVRLRSELTDLQTAHQALALLCVAADVFPLTAYRGMVGLAQSRMDQELARLTDEIKSAGNASRSTKTG